MIVFTQGKTSKPRLNRNKAERRKKRYQAGKEEISRVKAEE